MIQCDFISSLNTDDAILCQNESIMWHVDLRDALNNLLMHQDLLFVRVMLFSCDLLSRSKSLTDGTLSVLPLSERSYIPWLVTEWLMNSKEHDSWISNCALYRKYRFSVCVDKESNIICLLWGYFTSLKKIMNEWLHFFTYSDDLVHNCLWCITALSKQCIKRREQRKTHFTNIKFGSQQQLNSIEHESVFI